MNYYRHHIGDYLRDTAHLSMLEDAAYRRLLDVYYMREAPLPADMKACARLVRARSREEIAAVETVLAEFFYADEHGWNQKRANAELKTAKDAADRARSNGRRGGRRPRSSTNPEITQSVSAGLDAGIPKESSRAQVHPPSTNHQYSVTNVTDAHASALQPKDYVFLHGLALITSMGVAERSARAFLGKCCAKHGDLRTEAAVRAAIESRAGDPIPYITRMLTSVDAVRGSVEMSRNAPTRARSLADDLTDRSWAS